jgi:serine/threonine-protein kinase RsbW
MPHAPADVRLERDSTFESLEEIVEAGQDYAAQAFEDEEDAHRFVLAVSEAVVNAIEHGNAADPEKQVVVEFSAREDRVEASVTDEGEGFDPSGVEDPLDEVHLTRTHGRGLLIIKEVADEVRFGAEGRRMCIVFRQAA